MNVVSTRFLYNILRSEVSLMLSRLGIVRVRHLPTFVSIEPCNYCQLRCPECPVGQYNSGQHTEQRERKTLSIEEFKHILEEITPTVHTLQLYFQGEPLLNKDIAKMVKLARDKGLYTIISTNAQALGEDTAEALTAAGLNRIIISMDGLTQESYGAYRQGGKIERVLEALTYLKEAKKKHQTNMLIELQCLRLRSNEHEWDLLKHSYRELGADILTFKTAQLYNYEHGNDMMPTDKRHSRYQLNKDGLWERKKRHSFSIPHTAICRRLWTGCVITTKGDVLPCCYDKDSVYSFGNIFTDTLEHIYHSGKANRFRKQTLRQRSSIDICRNCGG